MLRTRISRLFSILLILSFLLASCASPMAVPAAPAEPPQPSLTPSPEPSPTVNSTVTPEPTPTAVNYEPPVFGLVDEGTELTPATNPPEYHALGGEIIDIEPSILKASRYEQIYRLYVEENGRIKIYGANEEEAQANFEKAMDDFLVTFARDKNITVDVRQLQSLDKTSLITVIVLVGPGGNQTIKWGMEEDGLVRFAEPNMATPVFGDIPVPDGHSVEFNYNPVDRHWYAFAVKDGSARYWFNTDKATRDNLSTQWIPTLENAQAAYPAGTLDRVEMLEDGRVLAIAKPLAEGKPAMKRVMEFKNDSREWIQYQPEVVGYLGFPSEEDVRSFTVPEEVKQEVLGFLEKAKAWPVLAADYSEHEQFPFFKDSNGVSMEGLLAFDRDYVEGEGLDGFVAGRIVGGFRSEVVEGIGIFGLFIDVPTPDGDVVRLMYKQFEADMDKMTFVWPIEDLTDKLGLEAALLPKESDFIDAGIHHTQVMVSKLLARFFRWNDGNQEFDPEMVGASIGMMVNKHQQTWALKSGQNNFIEYMLTGEGPLRAVSMKLDQHLVTSLKYFK